MQTLSSTLRGRMATWLLAGIIISAPLNLFYKFAVSSGYVQGLLVDYLLPKVYLSDFFIIVFLILSAWQFGRNYLIQRQKLKLTVFASLMVGLTTALILRQFWSPYPLASFWYLLKLLELVALALSVIGWKPFLNFKVIWVALLTSLWLQISVSLYQFWAQKPLAPYWLLGETRIDSYIGIAQAGFNGALKTLPYGTTAHPNVLAGTIALLLWLTWLIRPFKKSVQFRVWFVTLIPALVVLYLTQSISAWLALALSFSLLIIKPYWPQLRQLHGKVLLLIGLVSLPIAIHFLVGWYPTNTSVLRRDYLNYTALLEWSKQPMWGTGLNTMAALNENHVEPHETIRFAQPTHHIALLWLAETGFIGTALVGTFLIKFHRHLNWWLLAGWVPIMALDHYFLSLQGGMLLLTFLLQFCWLPQSSDQVT